MASAAAAAAAAPAAHKGWLCRWTRKAWSRHWFVLKGGSLTYFRGPAAELCSFLDGVLDLSLIRHIELPELPAAAAGPPGVHLHPQQAQLPAGQHQQFTFTLKMWNGEAHLLAAGSLAERALWLKAIDASAPESLPVPSAGKRRGRPDRDAESTGSGSDSSSDSSPVSNLSSSSSSLSNSSTAGQLPAGCPQSQSQPQVRCAYLKQVSPSLGAGLSLKPLPAAAAAGAPTGCKQAEAPLKTQPEPLACQPAPAAGLQTQEDSAPAEGAAWPDPVARLGAGGATCGRTSQAEAGGELGRGQPARPKKRVTFDLSESAPAAAAAAAASGSESSPSSGSSSASSSSSDEDDDDDHHTHKHDPLADHTADAEPAAAEPEADTPPEPAASEDDRTCAQVRAQLERRRLRALARPGGEPGAGSRHLVELEPGRSSASSYAGQLELSCRRLRAELAAREEAHRLELSRLQARVASLERELACSERLLAGARTRLHLSQAPPRPAPAANRSAGAGLQSLALGSQASLGLRLLGHSKQIQRKLAALEHKVDKMAEAGAGSEGRRHGAAAAAVR